MWIVNNEKARSQTYLKYDLQNLITRLNSTEHKIDSIIAALDRVAGGVSSGPGNNLMDRCRRTKNSMEEVRRLLNTCNDCILRLNVMERISDD